MNFALEIRNCIDGRDTPKEKAEQLIKLIENNTGFKFPDEAKDLLTTLHNGVLNYDFDNNNNLSIISITPAIDEVTNSSFKIYGIDPKNIYIPVAVGFEKTPRFKEIIQKYPDAAAAAAAAVAASSRDQYYDLQENYPTLIATAEAVAVKAAN